MKIDILGVTFDVVLSDQEGTMGLIYYNEKRIEINKTIAGDKKEYAQTIMHEVFHGAMYRSSAYQAISKEMQEIIADLFATVVIETIGEVNTLKGLSRRKRK